MTRPGNRIFCGYQPTRLQVTSDVTQVTLPAYLSKIPISGEVGDVNIFNTEMKILDQFLYALCVAAVDKAPDEPTFLQFVEKVQDGPFKE